MLTRKTTHGLTLAIMLAASVSSTIATAQQSGQRRGPPPEAIEACANQSVEAVCSFTGPRGDATGQCMAAPQNPDMLACVPANGPQMQGKNN